ncbi:MAG: hypothetical protein EBV34_17285, partial [Betaproteobacteria bacterium]|nr:hypothetical protein [Betaproteobacteria bacterium]
AFAASCGASFAASCKRLLLSATFVAAGAKASVGLIFIDEQSLANAIPEKQAAAVKVRINFMAEILA